MAEDPDPAAREQEQREAEIVSRHLHPQFTAAFEAQDQEAAEAEEAEEADNTAAAVVAEAGQQSSLKLQGGDIHRDLYRIEARSKRARLDQRAKSFSHPVGPNSTDDDEGIPNPNPNEPGSFRREFIERRGRRSDDGAFPVTKSFVDFLDLYGSFAGEDLAESDEETTTTTEEEPETRPLLHHRRRPSRVPREGDASNLKSFFTLLKAFIGTGIMFLPKAFRNGGILFSSIALVTVSAVTAVCFHLLLQCRRQHGGGYGEIGERISGPRLRSLILGSITISQLGFVCVGIIFTAENLHSFFKAITTSIPYALSINGLIILQLIILIPLAFVRNISKLGPAALLADVFILLGLAYIYYYDISSIVQDGLEPTVELFNPQSFTLTIGSCIFTFEGIGLILPIQSSMKRPQHFDHLLYVVMAIITVIFTAVGALSYGTFGSKTKTEIITNFPQTDKLVNAVQFLYSLAILVGTPVQLFPALRIMEGKLFGHRSGKRDPLTKWKKNLFRICIVVFCGVIAAVGAGDLDKFVSLIGSFACVPLVYIYPAYLHWKGVARSPWVKCGDILMITLGVVCMIYTTIVTVSVWVESKST
ncbi:hypothetical protein DTO169E5_1829 [Paecilomyces variotii]|nr:hypothetical protein DTO169E5_1829 [Paecilomyces variotii]KAJ9378983.1 hypothetical protein DTO063F5_7428 [Paecilomyces variotii]